MRLTLRGEAPFKSRSGLVDKPSMLRTRIIAGSTATAVLAVGAAFIVMPARAATSDVFVSPSGSDQNPGTAAAPLKTIQASLDRATAGVIIHLGAGQYHERPVTRKDGTDGAPITIRGPETGKALSGRYRAVLFGTSRILNVDHSNYVFEGFTIDGQEKLHAGGYPTDPTKARAFKDAAQSRVADGRLIYIGSSEASRDIHNIVIRDMYLNGGGGECVRLRNGARDNVVIDSTITWCGLYGKGDDVERDKYHNGEAVYIGTSPESTTQPMYRNDPSSHNRVENNVIATFGSECFNVKENAHDNVFLANDCRYNLEALAWAGSAVELRGHSNQVVGNLLQGSRGHGVKMRSDSPAYDKGGNILRQNTFRDVTGAAVLNNQETAQGPACGNSFDSPRVLEGFAIPGLATACSGGPTPSPTPTATATPTSSP